MFNRIIRTVCQRCCGWRHWVNQEGWDIWYSRSSTRLKSSTAKTPRSIWSSFLSVHNVLWRPCISNRAVVEGVAPKTLHRSKEWKRFRQLLLICYSLQRFSQFFIPRSFMYVRDDFNSSFRRWIFKIFSYLQFVETRAGSKSVYYYRCICPIFRVSCKYRNSGMPVNGFYTVSLTISSFILDDINVCSFGLRYKHKISLS